MKSFSLSFEKVEYTYWYGYDCLDDIIYSLKKLEADKFIVVTDNNVWQIHGYELHVRLKKVASTLILKTPAGEEAKSMRVLESHVETALDWGISRSSVIISFGGGVPGNLGGLMAALLFRGIRLVHIPTTLMGVLDSVISLKQAINSSSGKNLLGTYHVPTMICADLSMLCTLPSKEIRSGMCEVIKNALIIKPETLEFLREVLNPEAIYSKEALIELLELSVSAKQEVMKNDKCEKKQALVLEYGHTVGHAIELLHYYASKETAISHGEAVGLGMLSAAHISYQLGYLDEKEMILHHELLHMNGINRMLPRELKSEQILEKCLCDNKRGYIASSKGKLDMIILERLGKAVRNSSLPLIPVPVKKVFDAIKSLEDCSRTFDASFSEKQHAIKL